MARTIWLLSALASAILATWAGTSTLQGTELGCAKTHGSFRGHDCSETLVEVFGVWPFVALGVSLCATAIVAAAMDRLWVSWSALVVIAVVFLVGLMNWTSPIGMAAMSVSALVAFAGFIATMVQLARRGAGR